MVALLDLPSDFTATTVRAAVWMRMALRTAARNDATEISRRAEACTTIAEARSFENDDIAATYRAHDWRVVGAPRIDSYCSVECTPRQKA